MIVKIKTFSGENIYLSEEDYLNELMFSKKNKKKKGSKEEGQGRYKDLDKVNSARGIGRSLLISGLNPFVPITSLAAGASEANKAAKAGAKRQEIISRAGEKGALAGGITGGVTGVLADIRDGSGLSVRPLVTGGLGALGGYAGARKNTRSRLEKIDDRRDD